MKVAIIGCGVMGSALAVKLAENHKVYLYDRHPEKSQGLAAAVEGQSFTDPQEMVKKADLLILAVKPKDFTTLAQMLGSSASSKWVLSILTGVSVKKLEQSFKGSKIVRTMPNLSILHGLGVTGLVESKTLLEEDVIFIEKFLKPLGALHWIPESKIDALTSLTGSGPAFVLYLLEATSKAGVAMGFSSEDAHKLSLAMFHSALALLDTPDKSPREIILKIAAPGGTTLAGLGVLDSENAMALIGRCFLAACQRSHEISKNDD